MFSLIAGLIAASLAVIGTTVAAVENKKAVDAANAANLQAQADVNKTNKEIAEQTNKSNQQLAAETRVFNEKQSELAYQRSRPTAQVRELIAAGYSEQQAKQIVAGSGSPAVYTPAAGVSSTDVPATMGAAQVSPVQFDQNAFASMFSAFGQNLGAYADDLTRDDGGQIGYLQAEPALQVLGEHISDIDKYALTSPHALMSWLKTRDKRDKYKWVHENMDIFNKVFKNPRALRSLQHHLSLSAQTFTNGDIYKIGSLKVTEQRLQNRRLQLENTLTDMSIVEQSLKNSMLAIDSEYHGTIARADYLAALDNISRLETDVMIHNDPRWRMAHIMHMLSDERQSALLATALCYDNHSKILSAEQKDKWLQDPNNASMHAILSACHDVGLTSNMVGSIASVALALGLKIPTTLSKIANVGNDALGAAGMLIDNFRKFTHVASDKIENFVFEIVPGAISKTIDVGNGVMEKVLDFGKMANFFLTNDDFRDMVFGNMKNTLHGYWDDLNDYYLDLDDWTLKKGRVKK